MFRLLLLTLILTTTSASLAESQQPCIGYSKGEFTGNVTTAEICRTACQTAEGLCCPDFKSSTDGTTTFYKCQCKYQDSESSGIRNLCEDAEFRPSGSVGGSLSAWFIVGGTAMSVVLSLMV